MQEELSKYFNTKAEMQFVSVDGFRNYLNVYQPFYIRYAKIIIIMPALGVKADFYHPLSIALRNLGYIVVSVDLRGTGKSEAKPNKKRNFGYREMLNYDWPVILDKVNRHFPDKDIYLMGHSLGGQLNVLYAAKHKNLLKGLILAAACTVHYKAWKFPYNLGVLFGTQAGRLLVKILGYFPGKKVGFAGTEAKNVIIDWAYTGRTGKYKPLGDDFDYENNFKNIELPVLALSFENDKLAPQKAVKELTGKMKNARKQFYHFTGKNYNHFNWVKQNKDIVDKIDKWIKSLSPADYHNDYQ